jgi:hypothetical protein
VATLARELGATHVLSGPVTPPEVTHLIARWLPLAQRQAESDGWSSAPKGTPEPEPWNWLGSLLTARQTVPATASSHLRTHPTRSARP